MRVLLDENTPAELSQFFKSITATHVDDLGLKGVTNGDLVKIARSDFDAFVTYDKGILHQHNHAGHQLIIVLLRLGDVRRETVIRHAPELESFILTLTPGALVEFQPNQAQN